jgi:hypothetical protein
MKKGAKAQRRAVEPYIDIDRQPSFKGSLNNEVL